MKQLVFLFLFINSTLFTDEWRFEINDQAFSAQNNQYYVVMYTAKWCPSCISYKNNKLQSLQQVVDVKVVDVDEVKETNINKRVQRSDGTIIEIPKVSSLPTFRLYNYDNTPIFTWTGPVEPSIIELKIQQLSNTESQFNSPKIPWSNIVRLSSPNSKWSGIAISDNRILTCAHHRSTDNIIAQFSTSDGLVDTDCTLIKSDSNKDISLLSYVKPDNIEIKNIDVVNSYPSNVSGYLRGTEQNTINVSTRMLGDRRLRVMSRGIKQLPLLGDNSHTDISGMSGSPILTADGDVCGILWGGNSGDMSAVDYDSIKQFLQTGK